MMRWDVINALLAGTAKRRFLEIGVQFGRCGARVRADEKTGVDPNPRGGAERGYQRFHRGTSDEFFAGLDEAERFDVVLVDGLHHADQVERDVDNALRHLEPNGAIVLHDCNPQNELEQRVPMASRRWNGDCWKAVVRLRQREYVDVFTVDADEGLGIVVPRMNADRLERAPADLTYAALESDRQRLLGLVAATAWQERLRA
jgi:SAM-dependent methyltransferase